MGRRGADRAGLGSFSYLGARVAIRSKSSTLERVYGIVITTLGAIFLFRL